MKWDIVDFIFIGIITCLFILILFQPVLNEKLKIQKQEILASIDSIIDAKYGHIKLQQQDWDVLWSQVQYHSFYIVKHHPRSRKKLDGYQNYWHKKLENYNNLIKEIK